MSSLIEQIFSERGALGKLKQYRKRDEQIEMAKAVENAIDLHDNLIVEAGTGTGKTFAYLVPILQNPDAKAVIATFSLALQDQLINKDISAISNILNANCTAVKLKGINNYVCQKNFEKLLKPFREKEKKAQEDRANGEQQDMFEDTEYSEKNVREKIEETENPFKNAGHGSISLSSSSDTQKRREVFRLTEKESEVCIKYLEQFEIFQTYIEQMIRGNNKATLATYEPMDLQSLGDLGEVSSLRKFLYEAKIPSDRIREIVDKVYIKIEEEKCSSGGSGCDYEKRCPYKCNRLAAKNAKILILNHKLLCSLALTAKLNEGSSFLSNFNTFVIDEAHQFPGVVKETFSLELSKKWVFNFQNSLSSTLNKVKKFIKGEQLFTKNFLLKSSLVNGEIVEHSPEEREQKFIELGGTEESIKELFYETTQRLEDIVRNFLDYYRYNSEKGINIDSQKYEKKERFIEAEGIANDEILNLLSGHIKLLAQTFIAFEKKVTTYFQIFAAANVLTYLNFLKAQQVNSDTALKTKIVIGNDESGKDVAILKKEFSKQYDEFMVIQDGSKFVMELLSNVGRFIGEYFSDVLGMAPFDINKHYRTLSIKEESNGISDYVFLISPYIVSEEFKEYFLNSKAFSNARYIFASATLDTSESAISSFEKPKILQDYRRIIGLDDNVNTQTLLVRSPFDYKENAMLCIPEEFGTKNKPTDFRKSEILDIVAPMLNAVDGGTFILCTSLAAVKSFANDIQYNRKISNVKGRTILVQEPDSDKNELIRKFKEGHKSILIATKSFWEGVDIQGKALSLVIIDKLPFPALDIHLKAEKKYIGARAFDLVDVPRTIIDLKQGVGRLIRSEGDKGVVVICDPRMLLKQKARYRTRILNSLPEFNYTEDVSAAVAFLKKCH